MKRILSIILALTIILPMTANAADWVTVSKWAYTSVSNFKKEGLLPESFEDVSDYTQDITRLQFAELLYSALSQAKCFEAPREINPFEDVDNIAASTLQYYNIMQGEETGSRRESTGTGSVFKIEYSFFPDRPLMREEMAAVIYRVVERYCPSMLRGGRAVQGEIPRDYYVIAKWAQDAVRALHNIGIIAGMEDGSFAPKRYLTIEQAMCVIYSLYNNLPAGASADGATIHSRYEQAVHLYPNGVAEMKQGDILYLTFDNDTRLMEFEADIYTNIYCETVDGVIYAAAQNVYNRTDVFNVETKELLFKIPYPVSALNEDYIITKSSNIGPMTFGAYSYDGKELLPPEYSLAEIDEIKANGFIVPEEAKTGASGWIYYIDEDNGHKLYKIDSNGENKTKISDRACRELNYLNGRIYFKARVGDNDDRMYSIKPDGSDEQLFANSISFIEDYHNELEVSDRTGEGFISIPVWNSKKHIGDEAMYSNYMYTSSVFHDDKWTYYVEYDSKLELFSRAYRLKRISFSNDDVEIQDVANVYDCVNTQVKDGIIYFKDDTNARASWKGYEEGKNEFIDQSGSIYSYDGKELKKISDDLKVVEFGFMGDNIIFSVGSDFEEAVAYIADLDGQNARVYEDIEKAKKSYETREFNHTNRAVDMSEGLSDDKFLVYTVTEYGEENSLSAWIRDSEGNETKVMDDAVPEKRIGDTLYFAVYNDESEQQIAGDLHHSLTFPDSAKAGYDLIAYDMNRKKKKTVIKGIKSIDKFIYYTGGSLGTNPGGRDWLTYTDYDFNTWRYNGVTDTAEEVFPCKGIHSRGTFLSAVRMDDGLYKVDTEGNYSFLTSDKVYNYIYVENGAPEGTLFNLY